MKKTVLLILSVCLILCLFSSCSDSTVKMEYDEESRLVSEDGTAYKYAPVGYEPTEQGEEYGLIESTLSEKLYRIGDLDPKEWLTTEYAGAATTVYYSADIALPALSTLEPELCYICEQAENTYAFYTLGDAGNGDVDGERDVIEKLIAMLCDESVEERLWPRGESDEAYVLKLYSEDWPAIYYNLEYVREDGGNYVYDRVTKRCIDVGDLIEGYFEDAE